MRLPKKVKPILTLSLLVALLIPLTIYALNQRWELRREAETTDQQLQEDATQNQLVPILVEEEKSITVISPRGGEEWLSGNTYRIEWEVKRIEKVNILLKSFTKDEREESILTIVNNFPVSADNLQIYSYTVPILLTGERYKIEIEEVCKVMDRCIPKRGGNNNFFSIKKKTGGEKVLASEYPAPAIPVVPAGPTNVHLGTYYQYTTSSTSDYYQIVFDWGDGTYTYSELVESGTLVTASHLWEKVGKYQVGARAKDLFGKESDRSVPLEVTASQILVGDVAPYSNHDGSLNWEDVTLLTDYLDNREAFPLIDNLVADINGDGTVDAADVTRLQNYLTCGEGCPLYTQVEYLIFLAPQFATNTEILNAIGKYQAAVKNDTDWQSNIVILHQGANNYEVIKEKITHSSYYGKLKAAMVIGLVEGIPLGASLWNREVPDIAAWNVYRDEPRKIRVLTSVLFPFEDDPEAIIGALDHYTTERNIISNGKIFVTPYYELGVDISKVFEEDWSLVSIAAHGAPSVLNGYSASRVNDTRSTLLMLSGCHVGGWYVHQEDENNGKLDPPASGYHFGNKMSYTYGKYILGSFLGTSYYGSLYPVMEEEVKNPTYKTLTEIFTNRYFLNVNDVIFVGDPSFHFVPDSFPPALMSVSDSPDPIVSGNSVTFNVYWSSPNSGDQTKIHICKTNSISGQTCSGGSWCDTGSWSTTSPTTCNYTTQVGDVGTQNYYAFVCDDDNACSSSVAGSFTIQSAPPADTQLYEFYNTEGDAAYYFCGSQWNAQTFTPQTSHKITSVKLQLGRYGSVGTTTGSIRATDANGHPIGSDLCSGTIDGNMLTGNPAVYEISLGGGYNLSAGTKYAIVIRASSDCLTSYANWYLDFSSPTYAGGWGELSGSNGNSWYSSTNYDFAFEEWGQPAGGGTLPGDLDGDCDVDVVDIMKVAAIWNTRTGDAQFKPEYDFDSNGRIDIADVMYIAAKWNTRCGE